MDRFWHTDLPLWANLASVLGLLVSVAGFVITLLATKEAIGMTRIRLRNLYGPAFKDKVTRIIVERLRHSRSVDGRDVLYIVVGVSDELGIKLPIALGNVTPLLRMFLEAAILASEKTRLSPAEKERMTSTIRGIMDEINSWRAIPPACIVDCNPLGWHLMLAVCSLVWLATFVNPPKTLWFITGGLFVLFAIVMDPGFSQQFKRKGQDSSDKLIEADAVSDVVVSDSSHGAEWKT